MLLNLLMNIPYKNVIWGCGIIMVPIVLINTSQSVIEAEIYRFISLIVAFIICDPILSKIDGSLNVGCSAVCKHFHLML